MKRSEELKKLAYEESNDIKAWAYHFKSERHKRHEFFMEILPTIKTQTTVTENKNGSFSFNIPEIGIVDLYPKKNKILIRKQNKWKTNGLIFIIDKLKINLY